MDSKPGRYSNLGNIGEIRVQTAADAIATAVEDSINCARFQQEAPGFHKRPQKVLKKATSERHTRNVMEATELLPMAPMNIIGINSPAQSGKDSRQERFFGCQSHQHSTQSNCEK